MIRRLAPRRLGTDEEATVVEHLTELRHRIFIVLGALVPAFLLAFAFHTTLIEWLKRPLPADKTLVTLGVVEPFTTAVKVSGMAAIAIVLPILVWQAWGFLAPAVDARHPARPAGIHRARHRALRPRRRLRLFRRPARRDLLPDELRRHALQRPDPGELLPLVHLPRPARVRDRVRNADLHPRARPDPRAQLRQAPPQPPARLRPHDRLRDPAARRWIPSRSCSRRSRC